MPWFALRFLIDINFENKGYRVITAAKLQIIRKLKISTFRALYSKKLTRAKEQHLPFNVCLRKNWEEKVLKR